MINEILNKNQELFLETLAGLYLKVSKKDFKNLTMDSGSETVDGTRMIFSFYNDYYILDKDARKIFKANNLSCESYLKSVNGINKNDPDGSKKTDFAEKGTHDILDNYSSALALSYLNCADGTKVTGQWITFRELENGFFYSGTIPKSLKPLCLKFERNFSGFLQKAEGLGGIRSEAYNNAVIINPFKRFPMMFMQFEKDNEFDCEVKVLFDHSANHYLQTDVIKQVLVYTVNKLIK
jgi:hypothetical protein